MYLAIASVSVALLFCRDPLPVAPLLLMQVIYKVTTPLTVGTLANPVVLSNLAIAIVHGVTLALIARARWAGRAASADDGRAAPVHLRFAPMDFRRHPALTQARSRRITRSSR